MNVVRVRTVRKDKGQETVFAFRTIKEAVAFVTGLRVTDSWKRGERLLDATVEPTKK